MGEDMEVREIVIVTEPTTGRLCKVFLSENEAKTALSIGLNALVAAGLMTLVIDGEEQEGTIQ